MTYDFRQAYIDAVTTPGDINENLPILNMLAKLCTHVTEFGVRWGTSSRVWLHNNVTLRAYDIVEFPEATELFAHAREAGKDAQLIIQDTLTITDFEPTDLLFIDSKHCYDQVKHELTYAPNVRKFIVFHDTELFAEVGEDGSQGILPAIIEFLNENPDWMVMDHRKNNNGLTTLVRRQYL